MALSSMTGFSRGHSATASYAWAWEIKSVNAKGLDFRLRIPPGWDGIEIPVRKRVADTLSRGTVYASLTVERKGGTPTVKINEAVLSAVISTIDSLRGRVNATAPSLDGILSLKGVIEISDEGENESDRRAAETAIIDAFRLALDQMIDMRRQEGAVLARVLGDRLDTILRLTARAEAAPGRKAEAVKARLASQITTLLEAGGRFDSDRLHQEALLLAAKADIREELDRLASHAAQAKKLIADGGAVGRRLDFLAQELNRESNTLTAKSNDVELTNIGLELKAAVEQFREQVQNLE